MNMPQPGQMPSFLVKMKQNRKCVFCYKALQYIRHVDPIYWVMIISVALILFVAFVPPRFWQHMWSTVREHAFTLVMLALFGILSLSLVWTAGQKIDAAVFLFFNRRGERHPWLDNIMRLLTELGNSFVTAAVAVFLFIYINSSAAYAFILGSLILWLIVESIKAVLRRDRPFAKLQGVRVVGSRARGKSFPSGHTSQAFFTAVLLLRHIDGGLPAYIAIYALATAVGITRMYLGMHYPRDVLGGAILGIFWGVIGSTFNNHIIELIGTAV